MVQELLKNFSAFAKPSYAKSLNTRAIFEMANMPQGNNPAMNRNIRLAKELLLRPGVMSALDRNQGTGAVDGQIEKNQLETFQRDDNPFKYKGGQANSSRAIQSF